jgi:hypothetical protein
MEPAIPAALLAVALLVKVPFDFRAGGTHFGPGEYVVATEGTGSVTVRERVPGKSAAVRVTPATDLAPAATTVSFRAYGDRRFLGAIEIEHGGRWDVPPGADEAALGTGARPTVTSLKAHTIEVP